MTEADFISGCKRGEEAACKALVNAYSGYIYTICKRYVKDEMMVKDCMQESLIQIIRKIDLYEERGKFKSWVSTVTVKKCLDILRKEKRHLSSDMEIVSEPFINESVSHSLNAQDVMRFLDTLPDQYRIAINMFLVEGYSHKEIGKKLQISESSSRSLVSRGRKMIMKSFNLDDDKSESDAMYKAPLSGFKKKMVSFE